MSNDKDLIRLRHMLNYAREVLSMAHGKTRQDLDADRQLNLSLVRLLEITGEAAAHVSVQTQARYSQITWPEIVGLRNRLIHGYDTVDFDILWQVITVDLPKLVTTLEKILSGE